MHFAYFMAFPTLLVPVLCVVSELPDYLTDINIYHHLSASENRV